MRSKLMLGAAAALAVLVSPADASPPAGSHDLPTGDCTFVAVNRDPANPQNTQYDGAASCSVVFRTRNANAASTTTHATITVSVQSLPTHDAGGAKGVCTFTSNPPARHVVAGGCTMALTVEPGQALYVCTTYTWTEPTGHFSYTTDADPVTPGRQCTLAT